MATSKGQVPSNGYSPKGHGAHGGHHPINHKPVGTTGPDGDHMINAGNAAARNDHTAMDGGAGLVTA